MRIPLILLLIISFYSSEGQIKSLKDSGQNIRINGLKEGRWVDHLADRGEVINDTTTPFSEICICNYKAGKLDGTARYYYFLSSPKLILGREITYSNGILNGKYKTFHPDGLLDADYNYTNGKADGEWKNYYDTGSTFINRDKVIHHPIQILELDRFYKDGKPVGTWTEYWENGNIKHIYSFIKGNMDGVEKYYKESGKLDWVQFYTNGFLDPRKAKLYDKNGNPK